jgi:hypothetical protein
VISVIVAALDPMIFAPNIVLGIFVAYAFRSAGLKLALPSLAVALVLGIAIGVVHSAILESPSLPFELFSARDPDFSAWDTIKASKYEEHWKRFVEVRNQPAADFVKHSIDQREMDCAVLVGRGRELLSRCSSLLQAAGVAASWIILIAASAVAGTLIKR